MTDTDRTVTLQGNRFSLEGRLLSTGDRLPDLPLLDNDLKPVSLSSLFGKTLILTSVPSLDTPVCDIETRRFNTEATALGEDVRILTVSMDLPFAQKRWCGAAGVDRVQTLSDHRAAEFGRAFGVLIPDLRLLARAVFVADRDGVIQYVEIVPEIADEPDYDAVLAAARRLV